MSTTLIIDRRQDPTMPSGCGNGCGCASGAKLPAPPPEGGRVAVSDGLAPGERIVVAGVHTLREGQAVRLTDDAR